MLEPTLESRRWLTIAAALGCTAVLLGAFGSHGLRHLVNAEMLGVWRTGVEYQMFHALSMLALATHPRAVSAYQWTLRLWLAGALLFSGSLYAMVLSGMRGLGIVTPVGGLCFVAGWAFLVWAAQRRPVADSLARRP